MSAAARACVRARPAGLVLPGGGEKSSQAAACRQTETCRIGSTQCRQGVLEPRIGRDPY